MGKYLFQNGSVYFDALGQIGVIPRSEFTKDTFVKDKAAQVLINNVEFKAVTLSDIEISRADELVAAQFSDGQIIQYEKIGSSTYQGMAADDKDIGEIYRLFDRASIKVFIPYPLALRAFLIHKEIFNEKKVSILVDDLQDRFILTIFYGLKVSETREIPKRSIDKVAEEVIRSEKYFLTNHIKKESNLSFMFISNNKELCEEIAKIDTHSKDDIAYFEELYPAFLALDYAKFSVHFYLQEEIIKQRRIREFKRNLVGYAISGIIASISLIFFLVIAVQEHSARDRNIELTAKRAELTEKIKLKNVLVYKDILHSRAKVNLFLLYGDFIQNVPPGYLVENFSLIFNNKNNSSGEWVFTGIIYSNKRLISDFGSKGVFKNRSIENIFIKDSPAQRVVLNVVKSKGE